MLGLSPLVWLMISQYIGVFVCVAYYVYHYRLKIGYKAIFCVSEVRDEGKPSDGSYVYVERDGRVGVQPVFASDGRGYVEIGESEFKASDEYVRFRDKSFPVDLGKTTMRKRGITKVYYDFDNESVLTFGGETFFAGDARTNDIFMAGNIFKQFFDLLRSISKQQLLMLVLVAVASGAVCFVLGVVASPYLFPAVPAVPSGGSP